MDTIDTGVLSTAAWKLSGDLGFKYIHTVTVELYDGGARMIVKGFDTNDVSLCNERTMIVGL